MRLNRIIRKRLHDTEGSVIGDLDAAIAVNVGEPGGSQTHAVSHSHVVQSTRITQSRTKRDGPAAAPQADDPKEDA